MMQETRKRQTAHKVWIADLVNGTYVKTAGEWEPNYVSVRGTPTSRVNIIGIITGKELQETQATIKVDDGSATIEAKAWQEDIPKIADKNIGDIVIVIGKVREFNNKKQVNIEIIRKLEPSWLKLRKEELTKEFGQVQEPKATPEPAAPAAEGPVEEADARKLIMQAIEDLDQEDGADFFKIVEQTKLDEELVDTTVQTLLREGEIFEIKPGKLRSMA